MTTIDRKTATPSVAGNSVEVNSDPRASGRPVTSRAKPARSRRLWRAAILAPAVVVGTMLLAAPTAFADKSQVQIDCEKAGGTYTKIARVRRRAASRHRSTTTVITARNTSPASSSA
jgi:hypothetical protein